VIYEPKGDESPVPPDEVPEIILDENGNPITQVKDAAGENTSPDISIDDESDTKRIKYVLGDVTVYVVSERVQYYGPEGKLITESLKDYTRSTVRKDFATLDEFLRSWTSAERKAALIYELEQHGVLLEALAEEVGKDFDAFDLICHVAFDQPPLTRRERAEQVKKRNYFAKYGEQARQVLESLLEKYQDTGIENIEDIKILTLDPFKDMGTASELVSAFGGKPAYIAALQELEQHLYA
jgi:type I restriction enzyme R subunit